MSTVTFGKPRDYGKGSVEVGPAAPGETAVRRSTVSPDGLVAKPAENVSTIPDLIDYSANKFPTLNCLGWREVVKIHEEQKEVKKVVGGKEVTETKTWKYFELSDYKYFSYTECKSIISEIARGLIALGITTENVFNLYAQTAPNWQLVSQGCALISTPIATAYETLGEEGLAHSLNEPESIGLFTNPELLPTVLKVLQGTPTVKFVIYDGEPSASLLDNIRAIRESITVLSITELRELGAAQSADVLQSRRPTPDTLGCIMYTSGSTGTPKGVCITHGNIIANVASSNLVLSHHLAPPAGYLAYLPLSHVLEYVLELAAIFFGVTLGYARAKTLTDASVRNCRGDLAAFKPHFLIGVPAVWETIRKGILMKVQSGGYVARMAFNVALALKRARVPVLGALADKVVLGKVRAATGGNIQFGVTGGAAISKDTLEFLTMTIAPILQGYGMTESSGLISTLPPEFMPSFGTVGLPLTATEVKFLDVPEAGYLSTNDPPQGEVCIRGPAVTKGYYKRPDLNADETIFMKDGWLRTGDVGQWNADGTLSLIDRIKNLVKLEHGEYIALERLEAIYKSCDYTANVCVHATPTAKQPVAIIFPHEGKLRQALDASGEVTTKDVDLKTLCADDRVKNIVMNECNAVGKKNGFRPFELLQSVFLTWEEWTPENGLVTAAQKLNRRAIAKTFEDEINATLPTDK